MIVTSDALDLAVVELESLPPGVTAVPLAATPVRPGDRLTLVGHRADLDSLWNVTTGVARAVGPLADGYPWQGRTLAAGADGFVLQAATAEGDSGGPVLSARGELAGVCGAVRRDCPLAAVCLSAAAVRQVLAVLPPGDEPDPPLGMVERLLRATVWVRPTATDVRRAGVLMSPDMVLTNATGLAVGDGVGVALPIVERGRVAADRRRYADPAALHAAGRWRAGTVVAVDTARDLAALRLNRPIIDASPLAITSTELRPGEAVHAVSHPGGLELAWVYAAGAVRQVGPVRLALGDTLAVSAVVYQLPAQAGSPGGPVVNARGELVGVLSAREGAQLVGYAASPAEVTAFLRRTTTVGLSAGFDEVVRSAARTLSARGDHTGAVAAWPGCPPARVALARAKLAAGDTPGAVVELDAVAGFDRDMLMLRAGMAVTRKDYRTARGYLDRILDPYPADADARARRAAVEKWLK